MMLVGQITSLLAWLPNAVPCNAQGHCAVILHHPASPPVIPKSWSECVQAESGKGKRKQEGTKSCPGQSIHYSEY